MKIAVFILHKKYRNINFPAGWKGSKGNAFRLCGDLQRALLLFVANSFSRIGDRGEQLEILNLTFE
jgi:hypothetical protein